MTVQEVQEIMQRLYPEVSTQGMIVEYIDQVRLNETVFTEEDMSVDALIEDFELFVHCFNDPEGV